MCVFKPYIATSREISIPQCSLACIEKVLMYYFNKLYKRIDFILNFMHLQKIDHQEGDPNKNEFIQFFVKF